MNLEHEPPPPLEPSHVLVAEDNPVNQVVIREILRRNHMTCEIVASGDEAVRRSADACFDLVLMDCQMPVMDGLEATRLIRRRERESNASPLPIIALTASDSRDDRARCLAAGMNGYLSKPIDPPALRDEIRIHAKRGTGSTEACTPVGTVVPFGDGDSGGTPGPIEIEALLERCMGSAELAGRLLHRFEMSAHTDLQRLEETATNATIAEFTRLAHTLKGAAGTLGAREVRDQALALEQAGRQSDLADIDARLAQLRREVERLVQSVPDAIARLHERAAQQPSQRAEIPFRCNPPPVRVRA